jgi:hypothetical protein
MKSRKKIDKKDRRQNPYRAVEHPPGEEHPVDVAVERRLRHAAMRRRILRITERMMKALGDKRRTWLELEELLNDYHAQREEMFFCVGYEHGHAAGLTKVLRKSAGKVLTRESIEFSDRVRDLATQCHLPRRLVVAALLEAAWALVLNQDKPPSTKRP